MLSRRVSLVVAGLLLAGLTGCTPTPAPTPTPTGFASEEEAFAAAEETYRSYTNELNAYYAGDLSYVSEQFLSGQALEDEQAVLAEFEDSGLTVDGAVNIVSVEPVEAVAVADAWSVKLMTCLDYSDTRILNSEGEDVTPERDESLALEVELATSDDGLRIVRSSVAEHPSCE
jgi:hypothetical protein